MAEESRKEKEERHLREYDAYVLKCNTDGVESIDYMQWHFSTKLKEIDPTKSRFENWDAAMKLKKLKEKKVK